MRTFTFAVTLTASLLGSYGVGYGYGYGHGYVQGYGHGASDGMRSGAVHALAGCTLWGAWPHYRVVICKRPKVEGVK